MNKEEVKALLWEIDTKIVTPIAHKKPCGAVVNKIFSLNGKWVELAKYIDDIETDRDYYEDKYREVTKEALEYGEEIDDIKRNLRDIIDDLEAFSNSLHTADIDTTWVDNIIKDINELV